MANDMLVHAFRVHTGANTPPLDTLLAQIQADPVPQRLRTVGVNVG